MYVVILKLSEDEIDKLRDLQSQGKATDIEIKVCKHTYNLSESELKDTIKSYTY